MYEFLEYRVCDVMTEDPVSVGPDASLADVVQIFEEHDFNCVPVVAGAGKLLGIVTKLDLLGAFRFPRDQIFPPYDDIMKRSVSDVMTRDPRTATPREHLTDVLAKLVATRTKSLPVVADQRLVGVVAREDILRGLRRASAGEAATGPI